MPGENFFVSYEREDLPRVEPIVSAIGLELTRLNLGVQVWIARDSLHPGENWEKAIEEALESSVGLLFFISQNSREEGFSNRELVGALGRRKYVIPIILDKDAHRPLPISRFPSLDASEADSPDEVTRIAKIVAHAIAARSSAIEKSERIFSKQEASQAASQIAQEIRDNSETPPAGPPTSVFVVHGHDTNALVDLERYLKSVGVTPIVLSRVSDSPQSLFQRFMSVAKKARFAIVLLTADDYGASRLQYDQPGVGERALQFRPRQNVLLELGFFYGHLGWENVFTLRLDPNKIFPNFELPTDLGGVIYPSMSEPNWEQKLSKSLTDAGFKLSRARSSDHLN